MTTIAWDGESLAADSRLTRGDLIMHGPVTKIARSPNGYFGAVTGAFTIKSENFLKRVSRDKISLKKPWFPDDKETRFIIITPRGPIFEYWHDETYFETGASNFYSWGTGSFFALGALAHGATAAEAVAIAVKFDIYSGGKIVVL